MATAKPNNIIITKTIDSGEGAETRQVTIGTTRVEQVFNKALTLITVPKTPDQRGDDSNTTQILDLLMKAEKRITVDGKIKTDLGTDDTHDDAYDKKEDLRDIFNSGGVMTLEWEEIAGTLNSYTGNMEKLAINWEANDRDPIGSYTVKFTFVEGTDLS